MQRGILALLVSSAVLAGCDSGAASRVYQPSGKAAHVPAAVLAGLAGAFVRQYASADWAAVRAEFDSRGLGSGLVSRMEDWKAEALPAIKIRLVSEAPLASHRYVATLEFSSDPRAIPTYEIYVVRIANERVRIAGTVTGVTGTTYRNATWSVTRTKHFIVYHSQYELERADRRFLADLEFERQAFIRKFGVSVAPLIAYYYYPLQSQMAPMTAHACGTTAELVGCADPYAQPPQIHSSEWPSYHEPIHIYQSFLEPNGYVAPLFMAEGMAVALEDREVDPRFSDYCSDLKYVPLDTCAQQAIQDVNPLTILSDNGFLHANGGEAYALGGSFVKFLIVRNGYREFGRFYHSIAARQSDSRADYDAAAREVYHKTISVLLSSWHSKLCSAGDC